MSQKNVLAHVIEERNSYFALPFFLALLTPRRFSDWFETVTERTKLSFSKYEFTSQPEMNATIHEMNLSKAMEKRNLFNRVSWSTFRLEHFVDLSKVKPTSEVDEGVDNDQT